MSIFKSEIKVKVEFYDLDPMLVVWHGNYLKYLEAARTDLFKNLGYSYQDMIQEKIGFPIATMELKFIQPAVLGQRLIVKASLEEYEPAVIIKYEIIDEKTNKKMFTGKSMQVALDMITKETLYSVPEKFEKKIKEIKND